MVNHAVSNGLASEFVRCQKWVKTNSINTLSKILVQNNLNIFVGNSSKVIHGIGKNTSWRLLSSKRPRRGPNMETPMRPFIAPNKLTAPLPAKSCTPARAKKTRSTNHSPGVFTATGHRKEVRIGSLTKAKGQG